MNQLDKARKEILIAQIDELYPRLVRPGYRADTIIRECTWERPMPLIMAEECRWEHPDDAVHEVECGSDYYAMYECRACKYQWKSELPE